MAKTPAQGTENSKSCVMEVIGHTKGTVKFSEIDASGNATVDMLGSLYLRKSAVGELPVGSKITLTVND